MAPPNSRATNFLGIIPEALRNSWEEHVLQIGKKMYVVVYPDSSLICGVCGKGPLTLGSMSKHMLPNGRCKNKPEFCPNHSVLPAVDYPPQQPSVEAILQPSDKSDDQPSSVEQQAMAVTVVPVEASATTSTVTVTTVPPVTPVIQQRRIDKNHNNQLTTADLPKDHNNKICRQCAHNLKIFKNTFRPCDYHLNSK